jgi:hypothetical protein
VLEHLSETEKHIMLETIKNLNTETALTETETGQID